MASPDTASDAEALAALASDTRLDFVDSGVVCFCVAYLAKRVHVTRPADPASPLQPKKAERLGILIELHSADDRARWFREILARDKPILAEPEHCDEPLDDSPFVGVLGRR
jgi:hypothetical protein